ncbi:sigma 54-interacting transcriptional regulator [Algoriphagus limi]|uniref:Sigma-54 dependent transcriptional regulator n=1 Tax=Algoriphagus limi TaxID=2975273 RepID=A0ABT2G4J2_9BACT|nr:sigma-54 dependent transcriptional regulator [Algoriphagus limi]MCS5488872.1 sigma-54 dependent transcriptional regulator [Algoriphagus limi]
MRILISWQAYNHDYSDSSRESMTRYPNKSGPSYSIHQFFWEDSSYEKHILLNSSDKENDIKNFKNFLSTLKEDFPNRKIEGRKIPIEDVISVSEIISKLNPLLAEFAQDELECYISPGTPAMQTAWYLLGTTYKRNLKLFQTRPKKFTEDGKPERIYINLDSDLFPANITAAEKVIDSPNIKSGNGIKITKSLKPIYLKAEKIAQTDQVGVLILGENGTGKENLAKYIHDNSNRKHKPFLAVNCAAYSDELLRSELFGYEKGAFTGANEKKKGIIEAAQGGTVFLDEIGDISSKMQVSLLRVLQERKIQPVGSTKEVEINVRFITATNRNLEELCEAEKFRWDLFFRLAVTTLQLPALRDRGGDEIEEMIHHFNEQMVDKFPKKEKLKISSEVIKKLRLYAFKGNIRELQNLFIQFYTFCENEVKASDLPNRIIENKGDPRSLMEVEKNQILKIYREGRRSLVEMAGILGCTRDTLRKKLKEYGVYGGD